MSDFVGVLEASYDVGASDESALLNRIADSARAKLGFDAGLVAYTFDIAENGWITPRAIAISGTDPELAADLLNPGAFPEAEAKAVIHTHSTSGVSLATRIGGTGIHRSVVGRAYFERVLAARGFADALTINTIDPTRSGCLFFVPVRKTPKLEGKTKQRYARIAAHIAAGLRLRRAAPSLADEAVLDASGNVHDARGAATEKEARAELHDAVRAAERARGSLRKRDPEAALEIWRGLVAGRWSLVDRFEADGRRFVVAHPNAPNAPDPRGLTERERQVAGYVALGHSNKLIAYELGISASTVGVLASRAAAKLGVKSRASLAAALTPKA